MTRSDRTVVALAVAVSLGLALLLAATATWTTRPSTDADLDRARELAASDAARPLLRAAAVDCRADPAAYDVADREPPGRTRACEVAVAPDPAWYLTRPSLAAGAVEELEGTLLGLGATAVALVAGLLLGRRRGPGALTGLAVGAGVGLLASGVLWAAVTAALEVRALPPPDPATLAQVLRTGVATAGAATLGLVASRGLGGRARAAVVLAALAAGSLVLPVSALDVVVDWLQGR